MAETLRTSKRRTWTLSGGVHILPMQMRVGGAIHSSMVGYDKRRQRRFMSVRVSRKGEKTQPKMYFVLAANS